jgi:hypothetical protein
MQENMDKMQTDKSKDIKNPRSQKRRRLLLDIQQTRITPGKRQIDDRKTSRISPHTRHIIPPTLQ